MIKCNIFAEEYVAPELDILSVTAEFGVELSSDEQDFEDAPWYEYGDF